MICSDADAGVGGSYYDTLLLEATVESLSITYPASLSVEAGYGVIDGVPYYSTVYLVWTVTPTLTIGLDQLDFSNYEPYNQAVSAGLGGGAPNNGLPTPTKFKATLPGMNYCGPGGGGTPTNATDAFCAIHDRCFQDAGASWVNNVFGTGGAAMQAKIQACNAQLCGSLSQLDHFGYSSPTEAVDRQLVGAAFGCKP